MPSPANVRHAATWLLASAILLTSCMEAHVADDAAKTVEDRPEATTLVIRATPHWNGIDPLRRSEAPPQTPSESGWSRNAAHRTSTEQQSLNFEAIQYGVGSNLAISGYDDATEVHLVAYVDTGKTTPRFSETWFIADLGTVALEPDGLTVIPVVSAVDNVCVRASVDEGNRFLLADRACFEQIDGLGKTY